MNLEDVTIDSYLAAIREVNHSNSDYYHHLNHHFERYILAEGMDKLAIATEIQVVFDDMRSAGISQESIDVFYSIYDAITHSRHVFGNYNRNV